FKASNVAVSSNTWAICFLSMLCISALAPPPRRLQRPSLRGAEAHIEEFWWRSDNLERMSPLYITIQIALAVEVNHQPATDVAGHKNSIPGFIRARIKRAVADKAVRLAMSDSLLEPFQHKFLHILKRHHLQAGFRIAEKHRI